MGTFRSSMERLPNDHRPNFLKYRKSNGENQPGLSGADRTPFCRAVNKPENPKKIPLHLAGGGCVRND